MLAVVFWQSDLCSGEHSVLIQTEHSISGDGVVWKETATYYLSGIYNTQISMDVPSCSKGAVLHGAQQA